MDRFITTEGRVSRIEYFLWMLILGIVFGTANTVCYFLEVAGFSIWVIFLGVFLSVFPIVQRLHDLGRPGTHYVLLLIPLYNIYLSLLLLFKSGTRGSNQYGADPTERRAGSEEDSRQSDDNRWYQQAYEELETNAIEKATWAKSFADADGNEDKAKALYIKRRVAALAGEGRNEDVLESEHQTRIAEQSVGGDSGKAAADGGPTGAPQR